MNPNLIWDELQAKMADNRRVAEHRHLEGEAHKVCRLCGAINPEHAVACGTCGKKLKLHKPRRHGPAAAPPVPTPPVVH